MEQSLLIFRTAVYLSLYENRDISSCDVHAHLSKKNPEIILDEIEEILNHVFELGHVIRSVDNGKVSYSFKEYLDGNKKAVFPDETIIYCKSNEKLKEWIKAIGLQIQQKNPSWVLPYLLIEQTGK